MLAEIGYSVVGVDLSEEMIKNARKKMDARGLKVRLEVGDAEALPFEDASFDGVVNRAVLWTLPNPKKALAINPSSVMGSSLNKIFAAA